VIRAICTLASIAMLAACGGEELPAPVAVRPDVSLAPDTTVISGLVPRDATLDAILRGHGVAADAAQAVIASARTVFDPRRLRSLQPFSLERTLDGALRWFEYEIDTDSFLRIAARRAAGGALHAEVLPIPKTIEHAVVGGGIDATTPSLYESIGAAGEEFELALALAAIFAGEIDFNSELQPGDQYALAFERFRREGRPDTYGTIAAAEFQNDGRVLRAIRFTPPGGKPAYYDEKGRSLRRFFLRSPLKFDPRITSRFSLRRLHPVLRTIRAHRGVDYGAPRGAEVVAVASGTVISATYDNANGRMVRLRHPSGYESSYLHLSAFGRGIRAGARVGQGDVIGRVGSTGLATGPHLHYGLKKNGAYVDPLAEHKRMPPGDPIPAAAMDAFRVERDAALAQLAAAMRNPAVPDAEVAVATPEPPQPRP
jgi:murein DD-endopeptidase MepM/ murein hydrolase activator NlpD